MREEVAVEVRNLTRRFGKLTVLNNLNFDIYKGEIFGLLGPNGAGKSTFISILTALCKPTSGDVYINGFSVCKQPDKIKKNMGFVPQDIALYPSLSGLDNLKFWAGIYGLSGSLKRERIEEALSVVRLGDRASDRVDEYSGGMKRRLNIAVALLHHPDILIMDEPTVGVDIQSRKYILDAIKNLKDKGKTIIFASHYADEMELLCDRIAIMDKGVFRFIGGVRELREIYGIERIEDVMLEIMS
jgi:ABC-2 type transport system ATP-binding protein